jgi:hypothetical protein
LLATLGLKVGIELAREWFLPLWLVVRLGLADLGRRKSGWEKDVGHVYCVGCSQ